MVKMGLVVWWAENVQVLFESIQFSFLKGTV